MPELEITERQFQDQVIDLAHVFGFRIAHFRPAKTDRGWRTAVQADGKGYPDLTMVKGSRLVFAELKASTRRLSSDQEVWLNDLRQVEGVEVYVWRPRDFDEIVRLLREGRSDAAP